MKFFVWLLIMVSISQAEVQQFVPATTPKLALYGQALSAVTHKSPDAKKLLEFGSTHLVPFARPVVFPVTKPQYTALFVCTKEWRESMKLVGTGAYAPELHALYLDSELESWPHMGLLFLHELVHCSDDDLGRIDGRSLSKNINAEFRAYSAMCAALDDLTGKKAFEVIKQVGRRLCWDHTKSCFYVSMTQAAIIDLMLGFPRAKTMADLNARRSVYTVYCNFATVPSEADRRDFIRRYHDWNAKSFVKP